MKKTLLTMLALLMMGTTVKAQGAIELPQPEVQKLSMTLGDALKQRRSYRDMTEQEVDLQTVSTILWAACGISDPATGKITAPSAVNMQDIKVFVCSQYGVCRYMPKENTLEPVTMTDIRASLAAGQDFAKTAPVSWWIYASVLMGMAVLILLTVGHRVIVTSRTNPADVVKSE
jgi:hypothetical protein